MRYELLGCLQVVDETGIRTLTAPKIETLLAALLVRADQPTSISQLIDEIWLSEPPKRAVPALHVYVSQLRKFLSRLGDTPSPVVTKSPGYLLRPADGDEIDFLDFRRLAAEGEGLAREQRFAEAAETFQRALNLWRGPVFGELGGSILRGFATWLNELRLECIALMVTCSLRVGRHHELVPFLHQVVTENPLNEVYHQQLMLALYHCGRRAEALKVYHDARQTLRDELGLEPCRALTELQQRVLLADDELPIPAPRSWVLSGLAN